MKVFYYLFCIALLLTTNGYAYNNGSLVKISGVSEDSTVKYVKLVRYSYLWYDFAPIFSIEAKEKNKQFEITFSLDKPTCFSMMMLGETVHIYVTPGDVIRFKIQPAAHGPKIVFTGKNAAHYSYDAEAGAYLKNTQQRPVYKKEQDINAFKSAAYTFYRNGIAYLEKYKEEHPSLSNDFYQYAFQEIQYEYARLMCTPLRFIKRSALPDDYFAAIDTVVNYKQVSHLSDNSMLAFVYRYILYAADNPFENLLPVYRNIVNNFEGRTRAYLISNLVGVYAKKQLDSYDSTLTGIIKEAPQYVHDTTYLRYISTCAQEYSRLNRPLPEDVLENTYVTSFEDNSRISLAAMLDKYKNQPVYIDFWASWCGACREDIRVAAEAREFLKEHHVAYVYISIDKQENKSAWKNAAMKDGITKDQYLIDKDVSSLLAKHLKIHAIPRYILLGKDHTIKNLDAPRPTPHQLPDLKMIVNTATGKVYRYN